MKKTTLIVVMGLAGFMANPSTASAEVRSLRGDLDITEDSRPATAVKPIAERGGFDRSYKLQPPMIPHSIEKDQITLKTNTCMRCHSEENYEKEEAPKVGESHFLSRDGKTMEKMSSRRYFCNQCHAPQSDAPELVENSFQGAK
ncbi:nitrate reductase cytochrome c-type subunit [Thiohalomonas denitrificans]|uniref:Periplasmic nitrate reductase, electron transfer subunit n=1 Tax=Thiohalomonas denitrificans TaxID=415747 RepID=A0A1G5PTM0_9GAMM|nr:nitrate reductase cytochrome c-type subunit [Thiohalomonas denitrificans]SCZ52419.1 periplasmic nitrate reductase subunit NapB [Thiohalomonas denitrificans]